MNREIKFRAWFPVGHWYNEKYHGIMLYDYQDMTIFESCGFWDDDVAYMQYIGLEDKNGKEIYEGDICKTCYWEKQPDGSVILSDKWKRYKNVVIEYHTKHPFIGFTVQSDCEVIGNIFENPELL